MAVHVVTCATALFAPTAFGAEATLCNDDFVAGSNAGFQDGFTADEAAAVRIAPPADGYPFTIEKIQLLYGGAEPGDGFNVNFTIFDDDGTSALGEDGFPGTVLGEQPAGLLSADDGVNETPLDTPVVVNDGFVWVAIFLGRAGLPSVARDEGGLDAAESNAIFAPGSGGWLTSETFGLQGDWIIRAVVDTPSSSTNDACDFEGADVITEGEGEGGVEGEGEGVEGEGEGNEGEGEPGALAVTSINPSSAPQGEETRVTLTGAGFDAATTFRVGSAACEGVQVQNDGAALCTVPGTLEPGTYDVIAQQGTASVVFPSGFSVTAGGCACSSAQTAAPFGALFVVALARTAHRARRRSLSLRS